MEDSAASMLADGDALVWRNLLEALSSSPPALAPALRRRLPEPRAALFGLLRPSLPDSPFLDRVGAHLAAGEVVSPELLDALASCALFPGEKVALELLEILLRFPASAAARTASLHGFEPVLGALLGVDGILLERAVSLFSCEGYRVGTTARLAVLGCEPVHGPPLLGELLWEFLPSCLSRPPGLQVPGGYAFREALEDAAQLSEGLLSLFPLLAASGVFEPDLRLVAEMVLEVGLSAAQLEVFSRLVGEYACSYGKLCEAVSAL